MARTQVERRFLWWLVAITPLVTGCQGCREDQQPGVVPAAAVTADSLKSLPGDENAERMLVKPGHWMSLTQAWQSNTENLRGTLTFAPRGSGAGSGGSGLGGSRGDRAGSLESVRPAVLPKGQSKQLDCRLLVPLGVPGERNGVDIQTLFEAGSQAIPKDGGNRLAEIMSPHEYFFVVLSKRPEQMTVLQISDWARAPQLSFSNDRVIDYRIVFPVGDTRIPLPDTVFEWTSTAYVLWDDVAAEQLTLDQRRALRDWIYWGGQLLVNGPASAEALAGSDLADLLPIETVRGVGVEADRLIELVDNWSVVTDVSAGTVKAMLKDSSERVGIAGEPKSDAWHVEGTSDLVVERRLGRGRLVMTRFDITSGWMLKWDSLQSFYNGVLLRRPARQFEKSNEEAVLKTAGALRGRDHDARLNSRFRMFSRDANFRVAASRAPAAAEETEAESADRDRAASRNAKSSSVPDGSPREWILANEFYKPGEGVGSWNDNSDASALSAELLREEAGITIPSVKFVAKSLAIYLFILVPVNYLVFWLLGRLEWAWIMVPVIGLAGAAWIAKSAQLDIGFARSQTEIDILELHAGYQRGHLARYVAVYNSLSTTYELVFDSQDAVAAPFGIFSDNNLLENCEFRQSFEPSVSLAGVAIPSNQTGTIHAEQIVDIGGPMIFDVQQSVWEGEWELGNDSELTIYDAVVVGKNELGEIFYDDPGIIESGRSAKIKLRPGTGKVADDLPLSVHRVMAPLLDPSNLNMGQIYMVGRVEQAMEGLEIRPAVSQSKGQTVVLLHLNAGLLPKPVKDLNLRKDIKLLDFDDEDDSEELEGTND